MGKIMNGFPGGSTPKWLVDESGEILAPVVKSDEETETPTAHSPQIAAGYTGYTDNGFVVGEGKIVKLLEYGVVLARYASENAGRYLYDVPNIVASKISSISAVANSKDAGGKAGLTITVKKSDNELGYSIISFSADDTEPVQTDHVIEDGILRLEAFGKQYTKITYAILEEN